MFLIIDNYDSFTFNLVQAFQILGEDPLVLKNDDVEVLAIAQSPKIKRVCLSPGPGRPEKAGLCLDFLAKLAEINPMVPVLGVCLGHQVLATFAQAQVSVAEEIMHGRVSAITHKGKGLFLNLPSPMTVGRYHSLLIKTQKNNDFTITAQTDKNEIMALEYKNRPWAGVQFHPESILTPLGLKILNNFLHGGDLPNDIKIPKPPVPLATIFDTIGSNEDLGPIAATQIFERLMDGQLSEAQAGAFLLSLRTKGETPQEMAAAATAILNRAVKVPPISGPTIDVVGTGGDGRNSFNCSTGTAIILAALGHKVLKHGNRSVSSNCGSADVLERLGVTLDTPPWEINNLLAKNNFAFLFAPFYHPAFKNIMPVRRELGVRTIFNFLGPLVNPAHPTHRLIGVPTPKAIPLMAETLAYMGGSTSAVVHGAGGYDELSTLGPAQVTMVRDKNLQSFILDPKDYGFQPSDPDALTIKGQSHGEDVLRQLLKGEGPKAMGDMLTLNVGFALYLIKNTSLKECISEAREAVSQGIGQKVLDHV
ncbi:MAG: anthranilate phosphoribosyltransferase [Candidatus Adiutrix sp.]